MVAVAQRELTEHFDNTIGALLIGFAVSATAFGMLTVQLFAYCRRFPQDKFAYKALAALIWLLSLVDQIFIGYGVYICNVTNYLNPLFLILGKPLWALILQINLGAVVGAIVKACFTLRVWRFSGNNRWLTGFLFLFVFAQLGTATAFTVKCFQLPTILSVSKLRFLGTLSLGLGVTTDICIAVALCIYLQRMRSSYANAESMINKLIIYAVNTGILTSTISLSTLILFNTMPSNFIFICFYFVLSKLYAISFLATLNTRKPIRGRGTDREEAKTTTIQIITESTRPSGQVPIQVPMTPISQDNYHRQWNSSQAEDNYSKHPTVRPTSNYTSE